MKLDSHYLNGKSIIEAVLGINDLALWWSQWLLQVQYVFVFGKLQIGTGWDGMACNGGRWSHHHQQQQLYIR